MEGKIYGNAPTRWCFYVYGIIVLINDGMFRVSIVFFAIILQNQPMTRHGGVRRIN